MGGPSWAGAGPRELPTPLRALEKSWDIIMLALFGKGRSCPQIGQKTQSCRSERPRARGGGAGRPSGAGEGSTSTKYQLHLGCFLVAIDDEVVGLRLGGNGRALPHLSRAGHVALNDEVGDWGGMMHDTADGRAASGCEMQTELSRPGTSLLAPDRGPGQRLGSGGWGSDRGGGAH